jgi:hypothetical protein
LANVRKRDPEGPPPRPEALTNAPATAGDEPAASGAAIPNGERVPGSIIDPVIALRKAHPRARAQIALMEHMRDRNTATLPEIAHHVHDDCDASREAISQNVSRTNKSLRGIGATIHFEVGSGCVIKRDDRE